ncbi:DNA/RNA non-specific endonuclease [Candidatus Neptunochlamydia vexilliferae]|uniref:Nuclease n=1 Tax=Candidatus Neptunichlamydia vexilliferae TaxID=1651774 RepID=A0ABS0AY64_9BACT|nr:DNA/RNA non-specific endonuclease [Candidatus Neptunochlamydia vexilliferae]MBF5059075.1 hypothetical protein [Candidatus Neptunochlamydia vexilliferae]
MFKTLFPSLIFSLAISFSLVADSPFYPENFPTLEKKGYTVHYDGSKKIPLWTHEHLTPENLKKNINRRYKFKEDKSIYPLHRSTPADYKYSGFDKGQMVPRADRRTSAEATKETFVLSNVAPQNHPFNGGIWAKLENHIRQLVFSGSYDTVDVITGPLFLPYKKHGKKYVKYQVIGENNVAVPTHFYKVVYGHKNRTTKVWTYLIPVENYQSNDPYDYRVPLSKIEKLSGLIFKKAVHD